MGPYYFRAGDVAQSMAPVLFSRHDLTMPVIPAETITTFENQRRCGLAIVARDALLRRGAMDRHTNP
jgi:hypothetical protein